jgi:hypothetical protein
VVMTFALHAKGPWFDPRYAYQVVVFCAHSRTSNVFALNISCYAHVVETVAHGIMVCHTRIAEQPQTMSTGCVSQVCKLILVASALVLLHR